MVDGCSPQFDSSGIVSNGSSEPRIPKVGVSSQPDCIDQLFLFLDTVSEGFPWFPGSHGDCKLGHWQGGTHRSSQSTAGPVATSSITLYSHNLEYYFYIFDRTVYQSLAGGGGGEDDKGTLL